MPTSSAVDENEEPSVARSRSMGEPARSPLREGASADFRWRRVCRNEDPVRRRWLSSRLHHDLSSSAVHSLRKFWMLSSKRSQYRRTSVSFPTWSLRNESRRLVLQGLSVVIIYLNGWPTKSSVVAVAHERRRTRYGEDTSPMTRLAARRHAMRCVHQRTHVSPRLTCTTRCIARASSPHGW